MYKTSTQYVLCIIFVEIIQVMYFIKKVFHSQLNRLQLIAKHFFQLVEIHFDILLSQFIFNVNF